MLVTILTLLAILYLPGAIIFRLPLANRAKRGALPAEERLFWAVIIMQSLRNSVVGASASSTSRNITSFVVPARTIRARNSKSTAPSPVDVVVMVTSGPVAGSGIV